MEMIKVKTRRREIGGVDFDYEIGDNISIHSNISDPSSWFLTCVILNVTIRSICSKSCNKSEIKTAVASVLKPNLQELKQLIKDVEEL